jgi:hypothetical protein
VTTITRRTFRSSPHRAAADTWKAIIELLTQGRSGNARSELVAVAGIATSIIADRVTEEAAIVATCDGPRTRIYCLYDDNAIDGADADEGALGFDPLKGDWRLSLPCHADDLAWVQAALQKHSVRITARDAAATIAIDKSDTNSAPQTLTLDPKRFFGP